MSGITGFCSHVQVSIPPLDILVPKSMFHESGSLFRQLQCLSTFLG